jgi:hypothetical protein
MRGPRDAGSEGGRLQVVRGYAGVVLELPAAAVGRDEGHLHARAAAHVSGGSDCNTAGGTPQVASLVEQQQQKTASVGGWVRRRLIRFQLQDLSVPGMPALLRPL